jgi:subtilisin family serine protease
MMGWGVRAIRADMSPYSGEGVIVAVLDTGIDAAHPAFAGMELVQRDFTGAGNGDVHGHGTHCAGTIFGRDVDGLRVVAVGAGSKASRLVSAFFSHRLGFRLNVTRQTTACSLTCINVMRHE